MAMACTMLSCNLLGNHLNISKMYTWN